MALHSVPQYIGIAGITSANQIEQLAGQFPVFHKNSTVLAAGILMRDDVTENTQLDNPARYPAWGNVANCMQPIPGVMNVLHYCPSTSRSLKAQIEWALKYCGPHVHAVQINTAWPQVRVIAELRATHPHLKIILQVPPDAMFQAKQAARQFGITPALFIARSCSQYASYINYILLDFSAGTGTPIDTTEAADYLYNLQPILHEGLRVGIAGSLCGEKISEVSELFKNFPGINKDAESGLRNEQDELDLRKCALYLRACLQFP